MTACLRSSLTHTVENVKPVSMVQEWADRDTGRQVALKELTERLGKLPGDEDTECGAVFRCIVPIQVKTGEEVKGGERRATIRPQQDQRRITTAWRRTCYFCGQEGHINLNEIVL